MPVPKPLPSGPVARTKLAHKLARRADRIRQIATKFGAMPYRVFLTWERWSGGRVGAGDPAIYRRIELLPTPRVADMTAITLRTTPVGTFPEGSLRVDRVSCFAYTEDVLRGLAIPPAAPNEQPQLPPMIDQRGPGADERFGPSMDFYYEVVEDGRGDDPAYRKRFRIMAGPWRNATGVEWAVVVQRASQDDDRRGQPVTPEQDAALARFFGR